MTTVNDVEAAAEKLAAAEQAATDARAERNKTIRAARDAGLRPGVIIEAAGVSRQLYAKIASEQ